MSHRATIGRTLISSLIVGVALVGGSGTALAGASTSQNAVATPTAISASAAALQGSNGTAPPPAGYRWSGNNFYWNGTPGFPNATEKCLAAGRTRMQQDPNIRNFYCWDTAPPTISELHVLF